MLKQHLASIVCAVIISIANADFNSTEVHLRGTESPQKQLQCGISRCESGVICCNASCGICSNTGCVKQFCSPPEDKVSYIASTDENEAFENPPEAAIEADDECSNDKDCTQVQCEGGAICPIYACFDRHCVEDIRGAAEIPDRTPSR
jgi:hypothetical protein